MARIRTIKPEFWSDEKIVGLPFVARLFFIGLWNFADDYGALPDKPDQLKMLILPSEDKVDIHQMVDLLISCELLERYVDIEEETSYLLVKNWHSHQKVDKPTKSKIITPSSKKAVIPQELRRRVATKYGCKPGETVVNECYFCGTKGNIYWAKRRDGSPSGWVQFTHELSHIISESTGGETSEENIVLACRNCNRSMGIKNAFEWLFHGKYYTNQKSRKIEEFREASREFAKGSEGSTRKGKERKVTEGKGEDARGAGETDEEEKKLIVVMPFESENFLNMWQLWRDYKANEHKFSYKTAQSEQAALNDLVKISEGQEKNAVEIINQSMANGWKGFFQLKNFENGKKQPAPTTSTEGIYNQFGSMYSKNGQ